MDLEFLGVKKNHPEALAVMELENEGCGHQRNNASVAAPSAAAAAAASASPDGTFQHINSDEERSVISSMNVPLYPPSLRLRSKL